MIRSIEEKARAELFRRRAELLNLRGELAEAESETGNGTGVTTGELGGDFTDQASRAELAERLERLDESELRELQAIQDAIARLDAGDYGVCEACGGPIDPERLLAIPETRICIACAQLEEDRARPLRRRP